MATMMKTKDTKVAEDGLKTKENGNPKVKELMGKLRAELFKRGATGITGLARKFRIIDDSGDGNLDSTEFAKCMKEQKLGLTEPEVQVIFKFFDEDASGTITYDEFLFGVRGEMNTRREQMVMLAFDVIDADKSGVMDLDDVTAAYDAKTNPDVIAGKKNGKASLARVHRQLRLRRKRRQGVPLGVQAVLRQHFSLGGRRRLLRAHDPQRVAHPGRRGVVRQHREQAGAGGGPGNGRGVDPVRRKRLGHGRERPGGDQGPPGPKQAKGRQRGRGGAPKKTATPPRSSAARRWTSAGTPRSRARTRRRPRRRRGWASRRRPSRAAT